MPREPEASIDRRGFLRLVGGTYAVAAGLAGGGYGVARLVGVGDETAAAVGRALSFRSRPDLRPPEVTVTRYQPTAPGYLFLAPMGGPGQRGPLIVDDTGAPVWFRPNRVEGKALMNFRAQRYRGEQVLTWFDGTVAKGHGKGEYVIADSSYRELTRVRAGNGLHADLHEMHLTPQGTALLIAYPTATADLRAVGGPRHGRVYDNAIQEVDVASGKLLFEWRSLDHVEVAESHAKVTRKSPYDYFHANSVDVGPDGSLLVSARNTWALYSIDRAGGEVRWRLAGKRSDFELGPGVRFAWQHDARWQGRATISVFDDGAKPKVEPHSRGIVLDLDTVAMRVTLARAFVHPAGLLAQAMGSMQPLADGGACVGWGTEPDATVFGADGKPALDARLPKGAISYRAYDEPWTGRPVDAPALAVDRRRDGSAVVYASWNGATEIARWRARTGPTKDALQPAVTAERSGFETAIAVPRVQAYIAVAALDRAGKTLGVAAPVRV